MIAAQQNGVTSDGHAVMQRFYEENAEKRLVVILRPDQYDDWLTCQAKDAPSFFTQYPAERLTAQAASKPTRPASMKSV